MWPQSTRAKESAGYRRYCEEGAPIHVSNVMVICPKCNKPTRTGHAKIADGDKQIKVRVCKKCGANIKTADDTK